MTVALRPLAERDVARLRAIREQPAVRAFWGPLEDDFPLADEPSVTRFTIEDDGVVAGMIQFGEEPEPDYKHAWIDIFVSADRHGRGIGAEAIRRLVRHLVDERGHHRITIDPAVRNTAAIRCYENAGFRRVGVMQGAERDPVTGAWSDALLMEYVELP